MDEMTKFEQRFEDRVRVFALTGVRPVDSAAVAHAVAAGQPHNRRAGSTVRWLGLPLDRRVWTIAAALGLLVALLGGALLVGARLLLPPRLNVSPPVTNGWIAFTVSQPAPDGQDDDLDIWLAALDRDARRVVGSETDLVDQLCPAFSPDGRSLAYGRVEGPGTDFDADGAAEPAAYQNAALVVADVADDGTVADRLTVDVGDGLPPPCPVWSPDGEQVAFGVSRTSPVNPETSAAGSEVWVVTLADRGTTVLPDLLATDLEWSPDSRLLAIASGEEELVPGNALHDGRIHLYEPTSGAMRSLDATLGAGSLTWSPDGRRIAYATGDLQHELRVIDVETGQQEVLAAGYQALHGIGPVWSPDGKRIAYQRRLSGERHEVVLVTPGDPSDGGAVPEEEVIPSQATAPGSDGLFPYRVTWSPDGEYLLYLAWGNAGSEASPASLVAIPADLDGSPVVVTQVEGLVPYDGYPDTTFVPIQTWGRSPDPSLMPQPSVAAPSSAATGVLDRFLDARVAGKDAGRFLNGPEAGVPLLYESSSGAPYERAEFDQVRGIEWPYGFTAFRARLFAGDTVVEQLFFAAPDGPMGLEYQPHGFGTDIAPTTEDGRSVARPYAYFDGAVTLQAAHPWVVHDRWAGGRLIPEGPGVPPTTDGGERIDWDQFVLMADPAPVGTGCQAGPAPADAEALAESIRSDPDLQATAPVPVSAAGAKALMLDVVIAAGASVCDEVMGRGAHPRPTQVVGGTPLAPGDRMRLYLFDVPEGPSMRVLAMAIVAPESRFENVVEAAAPVIDSIEFHAP